MAFKKFLIFNLKSNILKFEKVKNQTINRLFGSSKLDVNEQIFIYSKYFINYSKFLVEPF